MPAPIVPRPITPTVVNSRVAVSVMDACSHAVRASRMWEPSLRRPVRGPHDDDLVAGPDRARTDHPGAQPAQAPRLALRAVDEGQRVLAVAGDELAAALVRLVGHHDHGPVGTA